jgi:hypothetical protein
MGRVRQCPYKTSFLCYFLELHPCFNFEIKKFNFQILGNFVFISNSRWVTDATTSAADVKK